MVRIGTEVTRMAQQAIAIYIAQTTSRHPTLSNQDIQSRKKAFAQLGAFHNNAFFGNLLKDMYDWYDAGGARGRPRNPTATETTDLADMVRA
ncbi:hypothetical protein BGZ80_008785, partial [Entomortierella chlamydospora]